MAGVVMSAGLNDTGQAIEPALTFEPDAERIVAVVSLGDVDPGQILTIAWNRVLGLQRERLFEHTVEARPSSSAFSVGLSPGELEEGSYEVVAMLGEHQVWTPWSVGAGALPPVALEKRKGKSAAAMEPVSFVAQGSEVQTGPPEPGESGTVPWFDQAPEGDPGPCTAVRVESFLGDFLRIHAEASEVGDCREVLLGARMAGGEVAIAARGPDAASRTFEPCQLPAGSDLPGDVIEVVAGVPEPQIGDDIDRLELQDLGLPPFVELSTDPPPGSRVSAGDTIRWIAVAVQLPVAGTVEGIRSLEVRGPEGVLDRTERRQRPCDQERFATKLEGSYTVPEDPPPLIEITAHAEDFADRPGTNAAYFSKEGQVWQGTHVLTVEGHPTTEVFAPATIGINISSTDIVEGSMSGAGVAIYPDSGIIQNFLYGCAVSGRREPHYLEIQYHSCWTRPPGVTYPGGSFQMPIENSAASRTFSVTYTRTEIRLRCVSGC